MGVTTKGLWYPNETDNISPLHPVLSSMQSSVDTALSNPINYTPAGIHRVANSGGLTTLLSTLSAAGYVMSSSNPVFAYRADTQTLYVNMGSGWEPTWAPMSSVALAPLFVAGTPSGAPTATLESGGFVQLDGAWQMAGTPAIPYNASTTLLTLPAGFRPTKQLVFPSHPFSSVSQITAGVRVETSGAVVVYANNGPGGTTTASFSLNAVRFRSA